ncbi:3-deoxy-7-phosphoheptulonate synthase [Chitiniphilus eburneus]|uniref:Phospho-2-dehydro-3-deoxyheptonate aldolase n=1 Tax=Chitiniphilus eburneus TaxID=2571148 RepID=A0A4U0PJQ3_9NEIS|nr:3-deoxy-7-phosphoheptulonate synthase [Chitiniphilus eburneus]TJZ67442.1 3-deoxy-7-phosphoheptulonate synthase [Chitiniphilus eburneus]
MDLSELKTRPRWHPQCWRDKEHRHMPSYPDFDLAGVTERLASLPGLVRYGDIERLQADLCAAAEGRGCVLLTGDAEEYFHDASPAQLGARLRALATLRRYLALVAGTPVTTVGLLAGNYARSRLQPTEVVNGLTMTSYYGDMVNSRAPSPWCRQPDAKRMLWAYEAAQLALSLLRRDDGPLYTAHEGANLHYEAALVRRHDDAFYAASAHLLVLEQINLFPDSSHLEFCRGVRNPIGVRVSPQLSPARLVGICRMLDPDRTPGKLVLISSMGRQCAALGPQLAALREANAPAVWLCDPLRGNTRDDGEIVLDDAIAELTQTVALHAAQHNRLAGAYLHAGPAGGSGPRPSQLKFQEALQLCSNLALALRNAG